MLLSRRARKTSAYLSLFLFCVAAASRTEPGCLNEQVAMQGAVAAITTHQAAGAIGPTPGTLIMLGPFGDPLFQASGWEKREYNLIFRESLPINSVGSQKVRRYVVSIHFMWNRDSHQAAQIKFKTSHAQGCVGTIVDAGSMPTRPPSGTTNTSLNIDWWLETPPRPGTIEITVSPPVPVDPHQSIRPGSCTSCHSGDGVVRLDLAPFGDLDSKAWAHLKLEGDSEFPPEADVAVLYKAILEYSGRSPFSRGKRCELKKLA